MSTYLLDTGVIVGIIFPHDLWRDEGERLFVTDNTLRTSPTGVYEYCNSIDSNLLETTDLDWESEDEKFGENPQQLGIQVDRDTVRRYMRLFGQNFAE